MKNLIARLALFLFMVMVARWTVYFALTEYHWHNGNVAYKQERWGEAIDGYSAALETAGKSPITDMACLYCDRGDAYDRAGRIPEAMTDYAAAIKLEPGEPRFYYERAIAYRRNKQFKEAIADLDVAIQRSPSRPAYYYERAASLVAIEEYRKAIADLDKYRGMIQRDKSSSTSGRTYRSLDLRGWSHYKLGEYPEALADFNEALAANPTYAQALHDRANVEKAMGRNEQAEADYQAADKAGYKR